MLKRHAKLLLNDLLLNMNLIPSLRKILAIYGLALEFGLPKLSESEFQKRFLNILEFILSFFQALFKRWANNKRKLDESFLPHIINTIIASLTKRFEMMVTVTLRKNLGSLMPKQNDDSWLQQNQEPYSTCTFLCPVKLMLRITNFLLHLVEITLYQK